ncbi:MAG: hypothetical protein AB7H85_08780 [Dehalococcoidia bacterium]
MNRLNRVSLFAAAMALLSACSTTSTGANALQSQPAGSAYAPALAADSVTPAAEAKERMPIYLTTMTHLEGSWIDDRDEELFLDHVGQLRYGMDLFEEYGARMTVESEKPFARASVTWDVNVLAELVARGHGVGTHCDIGFREDLMPVEDFAGLLKENKDLVDALVGAENNRGCSGAGGVNDWAAAGDLAGFDYINGTVAMHYLSMPMDARPGPEWTDEYIRNTAWHDQAPAGDLRAYPFAVADATDFEPDDPGIIVVLSGEFGRLDWAAEESAGRDCSRGCALTTADVSAAVATLREVDASRDPARVTKVTFYIPAENFDESNEAVLRAFLEAMSALESEGVVQWATQGEVYDAFIVAGGEPNDLPGREDIVAASTAPNVPTGTRPSGPRPTEGVLPRR